MGKQIRIKKLEEILDPFNPESFRYQVLHDAEQQEREAKMWADYGLKHGMPQRSRRSCWRSSHCWRTMLQALGAQCAEGVEESEEELDKKVVMIHNLFGAPLYATIQYSKGGQVVKT